jgi:hypothetical protein
VRPATSSASPSLNQGVVTELDGALARAWSIIRRRRRVASAMSDARRDRGSNPERCAHCRALRPVACSRPPRASFARKGRARRIEARGVVFKASEQLVVAPAFLGCSCRRAIAGA